MLSNETRQLRQDRRDFRNCYSKTTEEIIKRIARGQTSHEIAMDLGVPVTTVATTKGNFTRDVYYPYAYPDGDTVMGRCQY